MTGLPQGWAQTTLSEASKDISYGFTTSATSQQGYPKFLRITDVQDYSVDWASVPYCQDEPPEKFNLTSGDIVIARTGATTGKSYLISEVPERTVFASYLIRVRADACIDPLFLSRFMQSPAYWEQITTVSKGTAQPGANASILGALGIPLPPLPEQRRIVRKLDTLSARGTTARTHLTAIEKLVERYKRAVLGQFFPDDLPTKPLGVRCTKIGSGATPRGGKNVYLPEGTPLIRSQNVRFEGFDWDGLAFISDEHADELRNVAVRTGDVLLNITGASIGRVCLTPEEMDGARVNQHVSIIRPIPQELDAGFVQHFLSSPSIQNWIWNENYGVTRQALTKGMIEEIAVPDVSLEDQREIVRGIETAFAKIDRLAAEAAKALKLLGHLDQRILAKAFAGDLVPQDPADEPAETLLARIRETKAAAPKSRR